MNAWTNDYGFNNAKSAILQPYCGTHVLECMYLLDKFINLRHHMCETISQIMLYYAKYALHKSWFSMPNQKSEHWFQYTKGYTKILHCTEIKSLQRINTRTCLSWCFMCMQNLSTMKIAPSELLILSFSITKMLSYTRYHVVSYICNLVNSTRRVEKWILPQSTSLLVSFLYRHLYTKPQHGLLFYIQPL